MLPPSVRGSVRAVFARRTLALGGRMKNKMEDKLEIRELIENWAVWRDSLQWDKFRTVWHPEGRMWATWFQGTFEEFIAANKAGYGKGVRIYHFLGGSSIEIGKKRAIAQ